MWHDLKEEIELELAMLKKHLSDCSPLRKIALSRPPDHIESMALAAMLHAFYNGTCYRTLFYFTKRSTKEW